MDISFGKNMSSVVGVGRGRSQKILKNRMSIDINFESSLGWVMVLTRLVERVHNKYNFTRIRHQWFGIHEQRLVYFPTVLKVARVI